MPISIFPVFTVSPVIFTGRPGLGVRPGTWRPWTFLSFAFSVTTPFRPAITASFVRTVVWIPNAFKISRRIILIALEKTQLDHKRILKWFLGKCASSDLWWDTVTASSRRLDRLDLARKMAHEKTRESRGAKRCLYTPRTKSLSFFAPSFSRAELQLTKRLKEATTVQISWQTFSLPL